MSRFCARIILGLFLVLFPGLNYFIIELMEGETSECEGGEREGRAKSRYDLIFFFFLEGGGGRGLGGQTLRT